MNPSPRVSVCRSERQHSGQGSCQCFSRKDLWSQVGSRADEVLSPAGRASGGQCQGRSVWHGAALWCVELGCLSSGLEPASLYLESGVYSTLLGLFDKCLGTPGAKWGICPGAHQWVVPLCRHGCSDHVGRYCRYVSLPYVFTLT